MDYSSESPIGTTHKSSTSFKMNPGVNPSLINYVPSVIASGYQTKIDDGSITEVTASRSGHLAYIDECKAERVHDDRCEQLFRAFREEAGNWRTHRFSLDDWEHEDDYVVSYEETDDGYLNKQIIAYGLSMLKPCPLFNHYSYIKCVLSKKSLIDIDALKTYHYIQYLDVSGNKLTTLKALGNLPFLKYLNASHNRLTCVLDFKACYFLTYANLSHNSFKSLDDLSAFWSLTELNLAHNGIKFINGLKGLRYLESLNLSYNRIETIKNLDDLRIQFLYLQYNMIQLHENDKEAKLYTLHNIRTINLAANMIKSLKAFESVENLESLDVSSNQISELLDVYYLRNLKYLNRLNLFGNTVVNLRRYVEVCITTLKGLIYLDGEHINYEFWLQKLSNRSLGLTRTAAHQRLKLLLLEQLNQPQIWDWLVPYDTEPLAVIVLVGLQGSERTHIARVFSSLNPKVEFGVPHTTKPKHLDEIDGDVCYHVDTETFQTMLKEGKFFTYQEHLGFYYGIAHSEFRKADNNKILLFYTDLTMALSIKCKFLNTKLILTLPSTKKKHLENLTKLFAIRLMDSGAVRIINSPSAVKVCEKEFADKKHKCINKDVKFIIEDLVKRVSGGGNEEEYDNEGVWHFWMAPFVERRGSGPIDPDEIAGSTEIDPELLNQSGAGTREPMNIWASSPNKYVSFTEKLMRKIEENAFEWNEGRNDEKSKEALYYLNRTPTNNSYIIHSSYHKHFFDIDETAKLPPARHPNLVMRHAAYADIFCEDERIKAVFDQELKRREELLELHWCTPGLFRELVFSDNERETLDKLNVLVRSLTECSEGAKKPVFDFKNDINISDITSSKISTCFEYLDREMSISQKQAADYAVEVITHICGSTDCKNPACPAF